METTQLVLSQFKNFYRNQLRIEYGTLWNANLYDDWRHVANIVSIEFKHVSRSLVETEATLPFAGGFGLLRQMSLRQFPFWAFDRDVNLNNTQTVRADDSSQQWKITDKTIKQVFCELLVHIPIMQVTEWEIKIYEF